MSENRGAGNTGQYLAISVFHLIAIMCQALTEEPRFSEPIPNVTVALGRDASLPCVVENLGKFKVAWIHIDRQMILTIHKHVIARVPRFSVSHDNQKTWLLHVNGVQQEDRGYYMCQVNTNPMISQVGYLQVVVPPNIIDEKSTESSVAVREHQNITLTCKAEGFPPPKIMWRREDGQGISIDRRKKVLTDGPRFLEPIPNVTVALGRDASLPCVIENLGSYKVAWIHIDRQMILTIHRYVVARVPRYSVSHDSQKTWLLHVYGVQQEDRGYYMCQVNTNPMISQVGYLQVVVPPNIIDEESTQSSVAVREHQNITLTCKAEGFPTPKITWRREDGQTIAIDKRKKVSVYDGETLNLVKISRLEMGAYLCIASNGVPPSVSKRIIVDVEFSPMIWVPNQLVGAPAGTDVTIDCHTEAYPRSISYWVFDNIMLLPTKKYGTDVSENSYRAHMRLTIKNLQNKDFGNYRCVSKNSLGETEGSIRLYEIPMPSLPSAAKEMKSGTSSSKLENLLVKSLNPVSNEKKPGPSKMSREEVPSRAAEKEAKPPAIVHSNKSSGSFTFA